MERRKFIRNCCTLAVGLPFATSLLQSCEAIHFAVAKEEKDQLVVALSEFTLVKNGKEKVRDFVMVKSQISAFPICIYRLDKDNFSASLMKCTHRGCELNVGGNTYYCPCHGSEFSVTGQVLEGPANEHLQTFNTYTENENIYVQLS